MNKSNALGKKGEEWASRYLIKNNFSIVNRNFKCKFGEIDIIGRKDGKLYFFEVKTRSNILFGEPITFISRRQLWHMIKAIDYFMDINSLRDTEIQIDTIEIIVLEGKPYIRHIENVDIH